MTAEAIRWQRTTGRWIPTLSSVYRAADAPETPNQRLVIASLWGGPDAVLSHTSAAALWDLDLPRGEPAKIHVLRRYGQSARNTDLVAHRTRRLDEIDRAVRKGVPVTSVERTLVDLAAVLDEAALEAALESALRQHLTFNERLWRRVEKLWGHPRLHVLRHLLHIRQDAPAESVLEVQVERFLREYSIEGFIRQYEVWDGERWRRLDWARPDVRVALEAESWKHHSGRIDWSRGHTRNRRLVARGWRFIPITRACLDEEPAETARDILKSCDEA